MIIGVSFAFYHAINASKETQKYRPDDYLPAICCMGAVFSVY